MISYPIEMNKERMLLRGHNPDKFVEFEEHSTGTTGEARPFQAKIVNLFFSLLFQICSWNHGQDLARNLLPWIGKRHWKQHNCTGVRIPLPSKSRVT